MITSIFKRIMIWNSNRFDFDVAVPLVLRHITCPRCSSIFGVLTLAKVNNKLERNMLLDEGDRKIPNPGFRKTHLANPIKCPDCGAEFIIFAGVEYDFKRDEVKDVHVKIALPDDPLVKQLSSWPHRGLVMRQVLEFSPYTVKVFDSMDHFEQYYKDRDNDIAAGSLHSVIQSRSEEASGIRDGNSLREPRIVDLVKNNNNV